MKLELFKKLIKQSIKEAIREEIPLVLMEFQQRSNPLINENIETIKYNSDDVLAVRTNLKNKMSNMFGLDESINRGHSGMELQHNDEQPTNANPFLSFIQDAANNMTPQERAGLKNLG